MSDTARHAARAICKIVADGLRGVPHEPRRSLERAEDIRLSVQCYLAEVLNEARQDAVDEFRRAKGYDD